MRYQLLLAAGVFLGMTLGAQAHGQNAAAAAAGSNAGGPEAASNIGKNANYSEMAEHQRGGLHFTGKVAVVGGALPWDAIPVVVTCNGVVKYRTEADGRGRFTIQGSRAASELVSTKASINQVTASQLVGCDVQASMPGFKSSTLHIANQSIMDNPDIGTITLSPDSAAAGSATSATTGAASKDAMKRFDKARSEWQDGNANGAQRDLEKAVKIDPQFAEAWYQLGKLQEKKGDTQHALASYQKAVTADPKLVSPYEPIAELSAAEKKWPDVVNAAGEALKLDPTGTPQLWYFMALGQYNQGKVDDSEASARKSLAMDPQHLAPNTEQLLAVILAGKGELDEALHHLQNSLTYLKPGPNRDLVKQQIAQLEKVMPQSGAQ